MVSYRSKKAEATARAIAGASDNERIAHSRSIIATKASGSRLPSSTMPPPRGPSFYNLQVSRLRPEGIPGFVPAQKAAKLAGGKGKVEKPVLRSAFGAPADFASGEIDDATWKQIAALHLKDMTLDANAKLLIASKNPTATQAGRVAISKTIAESPVIRVDPEPGEFHWRRDGYRTNTSCIVKFMIGWPAGLATRARRL